MSAIIDAPEQLTGYGSSSSQTQVQVAVWNLNHRVGMTAFRPQAPAAAMALDADVLVFNEFYPGKHEQSFIDQLRDAGWHHQVLSADTGEKANRVLVASRVPVESMPLALPTFDRQFPANIATVTVSSIAISLIGLRVPMYQKATAGLLPRAWDWLENTTRALASEPAVILGDLNTSIHATGSQRRPQFQRILSSGWQRATPADGPSYFGTNGATSEIDHVLYTRRVSVTGAHFVRCAGGYALAGSAEALSDHAALRFSMCAVNDQPRRTQRLTRVE
jgi:endonuclease/exonuclease/phosphatase family metal-dependent hydrolase